jgi:probable HAF family extracellular repeat protein
MDGGIIDLGTLGGTNSSANDVNEAGLIVGYSQTVGNSSRHATLWRDGIAIDLNSYLTEVEISSGWMLGQAFGVNSAGWIVGDARNELTGQEHAFLLKPVDAPAPAVIPEPATNTLLLAGLVVMSSIARRRQAKRD